MRFRTEHDFGVDMIVTPDQTITCERRQRPTGVLVDRLDPAMRRSIPVLGARG